MPSSSPISPSASPEPADTMQIFVKNVAGDMFPMTVPQDLSIRNLRTLLSLRTSLPEEDLRLVYAGKHLSPSSTLAESNIYRESTLHLAVPLRGGMPPKKIRCTYKDCKEGAQRIIGDCGFCNGHFCGKHRLLEDHKCDGLEDCKKESHDRNAAQLNAERTQVIKGI
ncbi:putative polyubiquitin [Hyaloscypha variabilis]|uniref:Putative polyubiquitin n=1 Tax=Hyaloscypha variabilis (strain UAMH 11265 / GT02V1 / F) TaxID=1149755 RepID=A0A2J6S3J8_HYAVF|nr:putative polyubiquitin [Hyaloscypha variabilis F]